MKKRCLLIINADDCGLTDGVTTAILDCAEQGIVSSTTWLMNLPLENSWIRKAKAIKTLGMGVHLNITLGSSTLPQSKIPSLVTEVGKFNKSNKDLRSKVNANEVSQEYESQIKRFEKCFGSLPTHFDTHHQIHDQPRYFEIVRELGKKYKRPIRRSRCMPQGLKGTRGWISTHTLSGFLDAKKGWNATSFRSKITSLQSGLHEIMCHPGRNDAALKKISSLTSPRAGEYELFRSWSWFDLFLKRDIQLTHFGLCYNTVF